MLGHREHRSLAVERCGDRIPCALEDDEETVARGIDLVSGGSRECFSKDASMLGSHAPELRTESPREVGRSLDVREQKGDGSLRELGGTILHVTIVADAAGSGCGVG